MKMLRRTYFLCMGERQSSRLKTKKKIVSRHDRGAARSDNGYSLTKKDQQPSQRRSLSSLFPLLPLMYWQSGHKLRSDSNHGQA